MGNYDTLIKEGSMKIDNSNENKVLSFPLNKMVRQKSFLRQKEKKTVVGLSILGLFLFCTAVNQWVQDLNHFSGQNRSVASIQIENKQAVLKEHLLANEIASKENLSGVIGQPPSLKDELMFSILEGKYKVKSKDTRVVDIQTDELDGNRVAILNGEEFLKKYLSLFSQKAVHLKLKDKSEVSELYELIDQEGLVVDKVLLSKDSQGKLTQIKVL